MKTPLQAEREKRNIGKSAVATAVGSSRSHYGRVEEGSAVPSPELASRIAAFFGGSLTEMQILYPDRYTGRLASVAAEA